MRLAGNESIEIAARTQDLNCQQYSENTWCLAHNLRDTSVSKVLTLAKNAVSESEQLLIATALT